MIVDEHPVLRASVRTLLESDVDVAVVGEADSVAAALEIVRATQPDVVLLDVNSADAETIGDMRRLRHAVPSGALVVLARREDDEEVYRAVVGGADGHVSESAQPKELLDTIKQAARGGEPIRLTLVDRPAVARRVLETYAELSKRASSALESEVSEREIRILELAAEGKTNYQIGREIGLSEHTVKGAISHLLSRLRLRHRTDAVVHALRLGWISPPRAQPQRIRDKDDRA